MPNIWNSIPEDSATFAFSERQEAWTTRYSFKPTCYANCGDSMLSSKDDTAVWIHDVNDERNKFYGRPAIYPSIIEVSFNDLPSDVKVFNSVSVETNSAGNGIHAKFFSTDELQDLYDDGSITWDGQSGSYGSFYVGEENEVFTDLEGIKYLPVPRNATTSFVNHRLPDLNDSSTIYMGAISLDSSLLDSSFFEEQEGFYDFKVRLSKRVESSIPVGIYNESNVPGWSNGPEILIPSETNFKILAFDAETGEDVIINSDEELFGTIASTSRNNSLCVIGQDGDVLTLRYQRRTSYYEPAPASFIPFELFVANGDPVNPEIAEPFSFVLNTDEPMFLQTPNAINGEQMRSTYMRTMFRINSYGKYMELNAVNCDYDLSRNHHSLTQNS